MAVALVTGITGQDGGYLMERLISEGAGVHGLVRPDDQALVAAPERFSDVTLHYGDLGDPAEVAGIVESVKPDEIYNLGGISSVGLSWRLPVETSKVSGLAVVALLDAALRVQDETGRQVRFVQASSAEIFGNAPQVPQSETTPIAPVSPYGVAKAFGHHMVQIYRARGLHAVSLILYNHESPRRPTTFVTRKISSGVAHIAAGRANQLALGSLTPRRDWGWAPDYVDAMVRACRAELADDFVVATGRTHSVADFVAMAFAHVGIEDWERYVVPDPAFERPTDATEFVGDASKAKRELGWEPSVRFEDLVSLMVDHDLALQGVA